MYTLRDLTRRQNYQRRLLALVGLSEQEIFEEISKSYDYIQMVQIHEVSPDFNNIIGLLYKEQRRDRIKDRMRELLENSFVLKKDLIAAGFPEDISTNEVLKSSDYKELQIIKKQYPESFAIFTELKKEMKEELKIRSKRW